MPHSLPLITTLSSALGVALLMGFLAVKLRLPTLVGYLIAGIIIGPYTPGFVANAEIAAEFAEIGVMLLMFGVGLHFSLENLLATRKVAVPGAIIQIAAATALGAGVSLSWGWSLGSALVFGLALSVASTVVLIRALEAQNLLGATNGQIAVGWLIIEDIAMVMVLVFLPFIAHWLGEQPVGHGPGNLWVELSTTFIKITLFLVTMLFIGRSMLPKLLWHIERTGSRELFTLCVIAVAVSIAFVSSKLFDISLALGAFLAGVIIQESKFSRRAAVESLPFRDAFAVLFFVSVGMLFNPYIFIEQPTQVFIVVLIIVIGKSFAAAALVLAFRYPLNTALTVSASLAQIGEFSFILASQGVQLKLLSAEGQALILAGALISIAINPLIFKLIHPLQNWMRARSAWVRSFERSEDPLGELPMSIDLRFLTNHVVIVGYGKVGKRICTILAERKVPYVVIEQNREVVANLRAMNVAAVFGDAAEAMTLVQAHVARASILVDAKLDTLDTKQMISLARTLNKNIYVFIRVHNDEERELFSSEIVATFFLSEDELAKGISQNILQTLRVL